MAECRFEDWVQEVFGAEVMSSCGDVEYPQWCQLDDARLLSFLTRVFEDPLTVLAGLTDEQIAQGLDQVVNPIYEGWIRVFFELSLPWADRVRAIRSIVSLFEKLFAGRTAGGLAGVCYMWWDVLPTWGAPKSPEYADTDNALLDAMRAILSIDCGACQDSALHGLNHWKENYPAEVVSSVDAILNDRPTLSKELKEHAEWAKQGTMQ